MYSNTFQEVLVFVFEYFWIWCIRIHIHIHTFWKYSYSYLNTFQSIRPRPQGNTIHSLKMVTYNIYFVQTFEFSRFCDFYWIWDQEVLHLFAKHVNVVVYIDHLGILRIPNCKVFRVFTRLLIHLSWHSFQTHYLVSFMPHWISIF